MGFFEGVLCVDPCKEFSITLPKLPFNFSAPDLRLNYSRKENSNMYHSNLFFFRKNVVEHPCVNSAHLWPTGG